MTRLINNSIMTAVLVVLTIGCTQRTVTRVSPDQQIDLSGRWNDTDSKMVAEEMINDVLRRPWREDFYRATNRKPVVIVGMVSNKSNEHIESETFIKDIEREFINSGMVRVVQNSVFREKLREERAEQGEFASIETQAKWGKELGADFMMFGVITSIVDQYGKEKVNNYKVNLELASIETNEKVWIGDKEIKKFIRN
ncbi:penicillin-binding protein activator LpoB [Reichenbachiella sp. MALMAid0571]|uniref:penicillin-binding protein activator LpoB n=1 Tax=Reichenbachiella sp. MALMAid0571 TaxID=3143939 RepID=UPI0032DEE809